MKKNLLIILLLTISLVTAFMATAQDTNHVRSCGTVATVIKKDTPQLIADETWLTYLKTGAKVVTYSELVFKDLSLRFGDTFSKISIQRKKGKAGEYKEYTMLMSTHTGLEVANYSKQNL